MKASDVLCCVHCKGKLKTKGKQVFCSNCKTSFAYEDGIYNFNKKNDKLVEEYQNFQAKSDPYGLNKAPKIVIEGHERKRHILKKFFEKYSTKNKKVMDVGSGQEIPPFLKECKLGVITDISKNMLKKSRIKAKEENIDKKFVFISCKEVLPVSTDLMDFIFAGEIIEHVANPSGFVSELHRVLKPKGKLILTTPNSKAHIFGFLGLKYAKSRQHISLQDYGSLVDILGKKFKINRVYGFNQTFFHYVDNFIKNKGICRWWAKFFFKRPKYAANLIVECEK